MFDDYMKIPDETSLFWLFGCEPYILDKGVPIIYNTLTYEYSNPNDEKINFTISPSYNEIRLQVVAKKTNDLISNIVLNHIKSFEILKDKNNESQIKISSEFNDFLINIKPRFKIFISDCEH